jgi:hypothetical protein
MMKRPSTSETSKLEEKLDGIVTLLKSATQGTQAIVNRAPVDTQPKGFEHPSPDDGSDPTAANGPIRQGCAYNGLLPSVATYPDPHVTPAACSSSSEATLVNLQPQLLCPALQPSPEDADSYLTRFRTDFVKQLPFIVISPSMTSHQLRQELPILWVCIMAAASTNSTQQIALSKEVRAILGREAFVEGTRNMDLLLGILVYATW